MTRDVDAVIAGGGVAGSATAAALAMLGWSVLVVDPGQHDDRRLAGELIHPAGVAGLEALGLLSSIVAEAARLDGFVVFPDAGSAGCIELPYQRSGPEPPVALALDHGTICNNLLTRVARLPAVEVAPGWRVTGLTGTPAEPRVQIRNGGTTETIGCRLVVAADGASSSVRNFAGLLHRRVRNAVLTGYLVDQDALPVPGRGHIFTASGGPVLAYAMGNGRARVLFNRRLSPGQPSSSDECTGTGLLTARLSQEVEASRKAGTERRFVSSDVTVAGVTRGAVVLVGDSAGSCHPISASGMTMGIDDAIQLAQALRSRDGNVPAALAQYAAERRSRQRARILLAAMLHDVLGGAAPEMGMLRAGMFRYWSGSERARAASMRLLGMDDLRTRSILTEFLHVIGSGLFAPLGEPLSVLGRAALIARLSRPMLRNLAGAMQVQ